jgi:hypothetical protein
MAFKFYVYVKLSFYLVAGNVLTFIAFIERSMKYYIKYSYLYNYIFEYCIFK